MRDKGRNCREVNSVAKPDFTIQTPKGITYLVEKIGNFCLILIQVDTFGKLQKNYAVKIEISREEFEFFIFILCIENFSD